MAEIKVAVAQLNPTVGDLVGNKAAIVEAMAQAQHANCDLIVFPELVITGYPPEDLLNKEGFVAQAALVLDELAAMTSEMCVILGAVVSAD